MEALNNLFEIVRGKCTKYEDLIQALNENPNDNEKIKELFELLLEDNLLDLSEAQKFLESVLEETQNKELLEELAQIVVMQLNIDLKFLDRSNEGEIYDFKRFLLANLENSDKIEEYYDEILLRKETLNKMKEKLEKEVELKKLENEGLTFCEYLETLKSENLSLGELQERIYNIPNFKNKEERELFEKYKDLIITAVTVYINSERANEDPSGLLIDMLWENRHHPFFKEFLSYYEIDEDCYEDEECFYDTLRDDVGVCMNEFDEIFVDVDCEGLDKLSLDERIDLLYKYFEEYL